MLWNATTGSSITVTNGKSQYSTSRPIILPPTSWKALNTACTCWKYGQGNPHWPSRFPPYRSIPVKKAWPLMENGCWRNTPTACRSRSRPPRWNVRPFPRASIRFRKPIARIAKWCCSPAGVRCCLICTANPTGPHPGPR
ncbi:hypothetical protein SDC9_211220 [bioreactor metagenome]|uniref:Uncharacterized protein n=1 Tax=bioreactor metagenome TaxID=1076179 RepID=A0A645JIN0_9ZZZZ